MKKTHLFYMLFVGCVVALNAQTPCANDPRFGDQWNLHNEGFGIKACAAWQISIGTGIVVAVLDDGIDTTFTDLKANLYPLSYDVVTGGIQQFKVDSAGHGTACAGIICAVRNNFIDIAGVAPDSKLMPISFKKSADTIELEQMAKGIGWAWRHGADVISVSRSHSSYTSQMLQDSIHAAVTQGRNGKGTIVVYSAGNDNNNTVNYPSRLDDVIAVGGIIQSGQRCEISNYGYGLNVVAPSKDIPSIGSREDYRVDPGCYTSVACPHVSGIAALMLSVNPNLTQPQVRYIIESTCTKLPNYVFTNNFAHPSGTWNDSVGYGLVNAHAAVLAARCYAGLPIVHGTIIQNTMWNTDVHAIGTITVPNNVTLTIASTVKFDTESSIVVEPNAKLIIDGGTLTAACDNKLWKGIVVLGDSTQRQLPQNQGTVTLKSNAIIEHALCAISTPADATGGIITATNSTFRNNLIAIEYRPYENHDLQGNIADNVGKFVNCTFIVDDDNRFSVNRKVFNYHVWMHGVRGVTFRACNFNNTVRIGSKGAGIYTMDAGFKVINNCSDIQYPGVDCRCSQSSTVPTTFQNQAYGIYSSSTGSPRSIYIDQSKFQSINQGARISNHDNYRLTRCDFSNITTRGLYSLNSSGYRIEENDFLFPNTSTAVGIEMHNSGIAENKIYKNNFNNFGYGILVSGINGNYLNGHAQTLIGLQFVCNNFTNNNYDINISRTGTVRSHQGSLSAGADNTFSGTQTSSIYSLSSQAINYYCTPITYSPGGHTPYNPTSNVTVIASIGINPCASTFCLPNGGGDPGTGTKGDLDSLAHYKAMQAQYDDLLAMLDENPEVLQEILMLSDAMRELSDHAISRILQDSILYVENLKQWYEVVRTPIAKYCLAEVYFSEKKYEQAESVLKGIPIMFAFNDFETIEHENYMQFYNFKKQMILSERNWTQLNEAEIAQLQRIAEATNGRSAGMAKGVLCFFYDICYEDKPEEGGEGEIPPKSIMAESENTGITQTYELSVYPNPTDGELIVEIAGLPRNDVQVVKIVKMEVYDLTNRKVHQQTVNQSSGTLKMNELENGVYILKVWLNNGEVVIRKVVKQ